ncbi:MAG: PD-(D/E)XK nuclease family protein [Nonlabens sp.]
MQSFIQQVLDALFRKGHDINQLNYVVPTRRVAHLIRQEIASRLDGPIFEPSILGIADFMEQWSGQQLLTDLDLLPHFYEAYKSVEDGASTNDFDTFLNWAPTILRDFNEIERQLIDANAFFNYWADIKEIDDSVYHWTTEKSSTMVSDYLQFWKRLGKYHSAFNQLCESRGIAYEGLAYRLAFAKAESSREPSEHITIFLGLNALNKSESQLIQRMLEAGEAEIFWDVDQYFMSRNYHEAARFSRLYKSTWSYYEEHEFTILGDQFNTGKAFQLHGVTGNLGMVKVAVQQIARIPASEISNTVVVLADESLLIPLLNALPETIENFNVTMGLPLEQLPIATFFAAVIDLHLNRKNDAFYYGNVVALLDAGVLKIIVPNNIAKLEHEINKMNLSYLNPEVMRELIDEDSVLARIFSPLTNPSSLVDLLVETIGYIRDNAATFKLSPLMLEQASVMNTVINNLQELGSLSLVNEYKTIKLLFNQLVGMQQLDFIGEPVRGLQIMGLLETRALSYKNVIMLSMNEGLLPAGKTSNSFIPYDVRTKFNLPTYSQQDSIYAYHFYRLLHRVERADFIYNTDRDSFGKGEQSRFLTQLASDKDAHYTVEHVNYKFVDNQQYTPLVTLKKGREYKERLSILAAKGMSPSTLTSYLRNPLDFYKSKILKIPELAAVEEEMGFNTMGTVIHDVLEQLYKPYTGEILDKLHFQAMRKWVASLLQESFDSNAFGYDTTRGRNKIIYEVSHHYLKKIIAMDHKVVVGGGELVIQGLEKNLEAVVDVPGIGPVKFHGMVDRIDSLDGMTRIIDYKTGLVNSHELGMDQHSAGLLSTDYSKAKAFQVLMYAYLYYKQSQNGLLIDMAGVISFKNLSPGVLPFYFKADNKKSTQVTKEVLDTFQEQLFKLINEMYDMGIDIVEKEV